MTTRPRPVWGGGDSAHSVSLSQRFAGGESSTSRRSGVLVQDLDDEDDDGGDGFDDDQNLRSGGGGGSDDGSGGLSGASLRFSSSSRVRAPRRAATPVTATPTPSDGVTTDTAAAPQSSRSKNENTRMLAQANFGLINYNLRKAAAARRAPEPATTTPTPTTTSHHRPPPARRWSQRVAPWLGNELLPWLSFLDTTYVIWSTPWRLGFLFDPWNEYPSTWTTALTIFTALDLIGVLTRIWFFHYELGILLVRIHQQLFCGVTCGARGRRVHVDAPSFLTQLRFSFARNADTEFHLQMNRMFNHGARVAAADTLPALNHPGSFNMAIESGKTNVSQRVHGSNPGRHPSRRSSNHSRRLSGSSSSLPSSSLLLLPQFLFLNSFGLVLYCLPWEIVAIVVGQRNLLHALGLGRWLQALSLYPRQFSDILIERHRRLWVVQMLSFSSLAAIVYLVMAGAYLCHVVASGYMLIAHYECGHRFDRCPAPTGTNLPGSWVIKDRLENGSLWRQFLRSIYWGCKTMTTLGQGDLVPATLLETLYRVMVQGLGGLWATAVLTAYSFFFSRRDATMPINVTTRLAQATKFLETRKMPEDLIVGVRSYFQYMQRTRNGLEEERIIETLPPHYRAQCSNFVRFKFFQRISLFKERDGAFVRTILGSLEKDYFAPGQIVVSDGDPEEMFVVAAGEIRVVDCVGITCGRLAAGMAFGERALFGPETSSYTLTAELFTEVWFLQAGQFRNAVRKHFSRIRYASIMSRTHAQRRSRASIAGPIGGGPAESTVALRRHLSTASTTGDDLPVTQTIAELHAKNRLDPSVAWRLPTSRFISVWNSVQCGLLLLLIFEVPYQIAFQRGFGLLNHPGRPTTGAIPFGFQTLSFFISTTSEVFFYVDWYLRAGWFARPVELLSNSPIAADSSVGDLRAMNEASRAGGDHGAMLLLLDPTLIWQDYIEKDRPWLDVLANAPISLVWDILSKDAMAAELVYLMRFFRLFRLIRLRALHAILRKIMVDHAYPPSKRLLVYVVIFCCSSAHIAACMFFLVGDYRTYRGGLPVGGVKRNSIPNAQCLEDASLYGNCTWYVYDRSTFDVDAPFLRALQWSIVLLSTVGYGEIVAFSTRECIIGALWIFVGANICYFTGCVLSSVLNQLSILSIVRQDRVEEINLALLTVPNVTEATKVMIRSYYDTKWKLNGSAVTDDELCSHLPRSMRRNILVKLYAADLQGCPLFSDNLATSTFIKELAQTVRCEIFLEGVVVVREGHVATEFFVLQSGAVELLLPPLRATVTDFAKVDPGSLFDLYRRAGQRLSGRSTAWGERASTRLSSVVSQVLGSSNEQRLSELRRSVSSMRESTRASLVSSMPNFVVPPAALIRKTRSMLKIPKIRRLGTVDDNLVPGVDGMIPISILERHDYFGEESLIHTHSARPRIYQVNVRVVSSIQVAVIRRRDFVAMASRFPGEIKGITARLSAKTAADEALLRSLRQNFMLKAKIAKLLGIPRSLYVTATRRIHRNRWGLHVCDPQKPFARWWHRLVGFVFIYNFYVIIFRIAFLPQPSDSVMWVFTMIDYLFDVILYADIYIKHRWLGFVEHGQTILDPDAIRQRYRAGWFAVDCWSMLPLFYVGEYKVMTCCRLPRLLRSWQLGSLLDELHTQIQERFLRGNAKLSSIFDLYKFILIFLSTAHYVGSVYYLLGRLQIEYDIVEESWITADDVLEQYPGNVPVHYMRAMYWCLSTFTVDCFGDIVARNFLETVFSMLTCILGWIFIGQVVGKINMLLITLDKTAKDYDNTVADFDQYAKLRALPQPLRHRAIKSLTFKSECLLDLRVVDIFRDLPTGLRIHLFYEMYGSLLRAQPEFEDLSRAQLEAIASIMYAEIYMRGDVMYECGRVGTRLYILTVGVAEMYSPQSKVVFAAIEPGQLFGEFAFFIPGARRLASVRAVRSCQVLQLDRQQWDRIWPVDVRRRVERCILEVVGVKYEETSRAFLNIAKNFFIKNEKATIPASLAQPARLARRVRMSSRRLMLGADPPPTSTMAGSVTTYDHVSKPPETVEIRSTQTNPASSSLLDPTHGQQNWSTMLQVLTGRRPQSSGMSTRSGRSERSSRRKSSTLIGGLSEGHPGDSLSPPRTPTYIENFELPGQRRKSSLSAVAEALGISREARNRVVPAREDTLSLSPNGRAPLIRRASGPRPLARLTAASEFRWKKHEKRLAALRIFAQGLSRVERDLSQLGESFDGDADDHNHGQDGNVRQQEPRAHPVKQEFYWHGSQRRRASIVVLPSFSTIMEARHRRLRQVALPRRFSLQATPQELLDEFTYADAEDTFGGGTGGGHTSAMPSVALVHPGTASHMSSRHVERSPPFSFFGLWGCRWSRRPKSPSIARRWDDGDGDDAYEIWAPRPPPSAFFREGAPFRSYWDVVQLCVAVYYAFMLPFRVGFLLDHVDDPKYRRLVHANFALEYLLGDLVCVVDFVLRRWYFAFSRGGETFSAPREIAAHYWTHGTCLVDLVSLLPLELIGLGAIHSGHSDWGLPVLGHGHDWAPYWRIFALLRMNRFLRPLVHSSSLWDRVQRFLLYERKVPWLSPGVCYLFRLAYDFALGTHWVACLFYGISFLGHDPTRRSWLTAPGMLTFGGLKDLDAVSHVPVATKYLRTFHFSIGAITTVCYGDIIPLNAIETLATLGVIVLSVGFFSMLSGGFFKLFEMDIGKRADYEEKVSQVGQFMVFHQFPARTWRQMQVYFALAWHESKGMHEHEMLRGLTRGLRQEVALHVHANLLKHVKLLGKCDARFAQALVGRLEHELFVRNDVILQRGDLSRSLYIIESGLVSIRRVRVHKTPAVSQTATRRATRVVVPADADTQGPPTGGGVSAAAAPPTTATSALPRLRNSRVIIQDIKSAAAAAATSTADSLRKDPSAPTDHMAVAAAFAATFGTLTPVPSVSAGATTPTSASTSSGGTGPQPMITVATGQNQKSRVPLSQVEELKFVKGPFDYFGERSLLFGTPRNATCIALCVCSLFVLSHESYEELLEEFPWYRQRNIRDWVLTPNDKS